MSVSEITVVSNTYNLVAIPTTPAPASIELGYNDAVSVVTSPFTRQTQTQQWPGGDFWDCTITLPPLTKAQAWAWEAFLAELRGSANVCQIGDPRALTPLTGAAGTPIIGVAAAPMATTINTGGWTTFPVAGDYLQIQYRLYRIVNSDPDGGSGAVLEIWPSVREPLALGTPISATAPTGLFRLAKGRRAIQWSPGRLTTLSIQLVEAR